MPRAWLAAGLLGCALFGGGVALFSGDPLHRLWGTSAAIAYALAAVIMRHADLAYRARSGLGVPADAFGLGWDGRMLLAGLAAVFGILSAGYAVLAGYLWLLACWEFLSGWLRSAS